MNSKNLRKKEQNCMKDLLNFRHACKKFNPAKKIAEKDILTILEAGRLAPSSFGMEPWRFIVITDNDLKAKLKPACWDQQQITSCSHLLAITVQTARIKDPEAIASNFARRGLSPDSTIAYVYRYTKFIEDLPSIYEWGARQTYLAAMEMMLQAAALNIDSCPMEGFEKEKVEMILNIDTTKEQISLLLPLGYRIDPAPRKYRLPYEDIVEWR